MAFKKRGMSDVVANVLIILLVVVGVGLLWAAIRPQIEQVEGGAQSDCLKVSLEATQCVVDVGTANALATNIERNAGDGNLKSAKLLVEGNIYNCQNYPTSPCTFTSETKTLVIDKDNAPGQFSTIFSNFNELEIKTYVSNLFALPFYTLSSNQILVPTKLNVAAVVGGDEKTCEPVSTPIKCDCINGVGSTYINNCPP